MTTGIEEEIELELSNNYIGVVINRFGKDVSVLPSDEMYFRIRTEVAVSPQFYGWFCSFGDGQSAYISYRVFQERQKDDGSRRPPQNSSCLASIILVLGIIIILIVSFAR